MSIAICSRVYVNFGVLNGLATVTLSQPNFKLASSKDCVLTTGLSRLNFITSTLDDAKPTNVMYVKCSMSGVTISNGDGNDAVDCDADEGEPYYGWQKLEEFNPAMGIVVAEIAAT